MEKSIHVVAVALLRQLPEPGFDAETFLFQIFLNGLSEILSDANCQVETFSQVPRQEAL